ncbi:sialate O-acetylesterase [Puniceicoccaceae bacterium K14]|nr:sialate O-acetylesterase [Puniceicoccaceae bacterium K14]
MKTRNRLLLTIAATLVTSLSLTADVKVPSIFGDHMVFQQKQKNPVWGSADPGEKITLSIGKQKHKTVADSEGAWKIVLDPLDTKLSYELKIKGKNTLVFTDVLVGEVWICSGQSNMEWSLTRSSNSELEIASANHPRIRLISVPRKGTQEPQDDFEGEWSVCTPETAESFSAVGYHFGTRLHQILDVPIGLINNAWGGSAAEAWVRRDILESDAFYTPLMQQWEETEATYDYEEVLKEYELTLKEWEESDQSERRPRKPGNILKDRHRPANIYNGVLHPIIGFGIKGVIWYQGESNAKRAYQYRKLFPLMIENWRDEWQQGDFPFYYVQLADYREEQAEPGDSDWAELREAQTMAMNLLPNLGQAVIIDVGEGRDIHPTDKNTVANRLVRWALANDYGYNQVSYHSPVYKNVSFANGKATIDFDHVGKGLYAFDTKEVIGFAIAGEDKQFVWAEAKIVDKDTIEIWSDSVETPAAVRYAWADNPVCNVINREGLPLTPFRSDNWPGITHNAHK